MLEQASLLLRPWIHSFEATWPRNPVAGFGWVRAIVNPSTDRALGFAAWDGGGFFGWLAWLGRKRIRVFESDDQSLLMILYRSWGLARRWEVVDAEERRVGHLYREAIYDGFGVKLATVCVTTDGSDSVLRGEEGIILASWQDIPGQGCYFRFGETTADNPFLRMASLAGALALPPWPGDLILAAKPAL
jgi:hypothetical protein